MRMILFTTLVTLDEVINLSNPQFFRLSKRSIYQQEIFEMETLNNIICVKPLVNSHWYIKRAKERKF